MFIANNDALMLLAPQGAKFVSNSITLIYCAPTEREITKRRGGYKHLAPVGRNPKTFSPLMLLLLYSAPVSD